MVMSGGGDSEAEFQIKFGIDIQALQAQLKQVFGNIPNMIGQASGQAGGGGGGANESGQVNAPSKEQDERSKVRTGALKHLAQQFPGGGLMTSMASAFKSGGLMAGVATGITAAVGILTSIMKSSQVFQMLSGTVFKVLGFMADMFLMPFVPMMMKFVNWMLTHMPTMVAAGEKTVGILEGIARVLGWGSRQQEAGKERGGFLGGAQRVLGAATNVKTLAGAGMVATGVGMTVASGGLLSPVGAGLVMGGGGLVASGVSDSFQMGGRVPGSPGQGVPAMLHGGEMVIPQDIAAGAKGLGGRVASWIERFEQKEMGPGGVVNKWYNEMFGNSIIPKMWGDIRGLFQGIQGESEAVGRSVDASTGDIEKDQKSFWSNLKFWEYFDDGWNAIKKTFEGIGSKIKDFFTFDIDFPSFPSFNWSSLTRKLSQVGASVQGWIASASNVVIPSFAAPYFSWGTIWDCIQAVGSSIRGFFTDTLPSALVSAYDGVVGGIASAGRGLWGLGRTIVTYLGYAGSAVKSFFTTTIPGKIWDAWEKITGWAPSLGDIGGLITAALDVLGSAVKGAADKIKAGISGAWSWISGRTFGRLSGSGKYVAPRKPPTGGGGVGGGNDEGDGVVVTTGDGEVTTNGEIKDQTGGTPASGWPMSEENMDAVASMAGAGVGAGALGAGEAGYGGAGGMTSAPAVYYESGAGTIEGAMTTNLGTITKSGSYIANHSMTGMIASGIHSRGRAFGRLGGGSGSGGGIAVANRTVNISISSNQSIADIVKDVERLQTMDEASFFNSVF